MEENCTVENFKRKVGYFPGNPFMSMSMETQQDSVSPDIFRILITNDNHIGFKQDDPVRSKDALVTFEEIIEIARQKNVDFILHSGDLFDECRPNRFWMTSVMRLLQEKCFGDREVAFSQLKTEYSKAANFESPHRNIDLPIYMIHGNHDDPGGEYGDPYALSVADTLAANYLVNYFGRQDNVEEEMEVKPVLLQKGSSRLALYGLGNVHEERLHRMFLAKKVKFLAPPENGGFFNLMSIHQNRPRGAAKNCVHDSFLPSFLNLVVWAHEHECIPTPQESVECGFHILQSGSSVQTSLTHAEQVAKHVFLLEVCGDKFRTTGIPLLSVRTLVIDDLLIPGNIALNSPQGESLLSAKVDAMIARGREESEVRLGLYTDWIQQRVEKKCMFFEPNSPELPLVRLRLQQVSSAVGGSSNLHILNQKFGRNFTGRVANPGDLLQFVGGHRNRRQQQQQLGVVQLEIEDAEPTNTNPDVVVQDLIFSYMGGHSGEALLDAVAEPDFNLAVQDYVHKSDLGAIERFLKKELSEINRVTLEAGVSDTSSLVQAVKKRAQDIRNERLSAAISAAAPVTMMFSNPEEEVTLPATKRARPLEEDFVINNISNTSQVGGDSVVPRQWARRM